MKLNGTYTIIRINVDIKKTLRVLIKKEMKQTLTTVQNIYTYMFTLECILQIFEQ